MAGIIRTTRAPLNEVPALITEAEQGAGRTCQNDLQEELTKLASEVRREFTPLAMLYDLRSFGGVAHLPNEKRIAEATALLGLPERNWHRRDYLSIVKQVATSIQRIASRLFLATTGV